MNMETVLIILYFILGYNSINYCKYHILHIRYELVYGIGNHFITTLILGAMIGFITIPIMILHKIFFNRNN